MNLNIKMLDEKAKKRWGHVSFKGQLKVNNFIEDLYLAVGWK